MIFDNLYCSNIVISLKSKVYVFSKFYHENIILLYNNQHKYKFKLPYLYIRVYRIIRQLSFCEIIIGTLKMYDD